MKVAICCSIPILRGWEDPDRSEIDPVLLHELVPQSRREVLDITAQMTKNVLVLNIRIKNTEPVKNLRQFVHYHTLLLETLYMKMIFVGR